jgi:NAD(P)-dependent dehydrogenase (short-subunit alcohol dehydrogenase family)
MALHEKCWAVHCGSLDIGFSMDHKKRKSVLITGAAGGLGSALSMCAAIGGWQVIMMDKNKRGLERHCDEIVAAGGVAPILHPMDLAALNPPACKQLLCALQEQLGGLNALVHCAVSFRGLQPLDLIEPTDWLEQIQVNVNAPWLLSTQCMPVLQKAKTASLIFILDDQPESKALWGAYGVSKASTKAMANQFFAELQNSPIRVHAIDPGPMRSALRASVYHSEHPGDVQAPEAAAANIFRLMEHDASGLESEVNIQAD